MLMVGWSRRGYIVWMVPVVAGGEAPAVAAVEVVVGIVAPGLHFPPRRLLLIPELVVGSLEDGLGGPVLPLLNKASTGLLPAGRKIMGSFQERRSGPMDYTGLFIRITTSVAVAGGSCGGLFGESSRVVPRVKGTSPRLLSQVAILLWLLLI